MLTRDDAALCERLDCSFRQPALLLRALTHRSYSSEHYERLEFLGDSVLGAVIARHLLEAYPALNEGDLSRLRSNLVKEETLATLAQQLDLGRLLRLGEGERKSGGQQRVSILADAMEALFGAVFLDQGYAAAERVVLKLYVPYLQQVDVHTLGKDPKTLLQEYLQARRLALPSYRIVATEGQAHEQSFRVECTVAAKKLVTQGTGSSRRNAEQQAAQAAYQQLIATHD